MGDVTVSIDSQNVVINNTQYRLSEVFKMGTQQGITFDEHFWRKVFCGDANKDGCPMDILKKFVTGWDDDIISATDVKKISSNMTNSLIDNNLIFKAEILRLKKYKKEFPEELKTQFDSAFQENPRVYVNKDCGLNPAIFMVAGKCYKSCNVASDVIDPHSAKTDDCNTLFPSRGHNLTLDPSVFQYLQYPRPCRLRARTLGSGNYDLDFRITDINRTETPFTVDYFEGNATKKTSLKKGTNPSDIENNAKLCIAKYSGDTLQSFIQRIFQLHQKEPLNEFVVSTCDSIVALRSFALNSSYIEITDDETKEKVTQVFIWRPNLADPVALGRIFRAEKDKIVQEYADFYDLINGIKTQQNNPEHDFNNIYVSGSSTTYKFKDEFYDRILIDITTISLAIDGAQFNQNDQGGLSIRTLRTFKINDFIKINGPRGKYYCITMASKYTKGNLNIIGVNQNSMSIDKKQSQSFFEVGTKDFKFNGGKLRNKKNKRDYVGGSDERPPNTMDLINMLNYYYDFDFYKSNPIVKTMFNDGDTDDDNKARINKDIDLHNQFLIDFKTEFDKHIDNYRPYYNLLFFDCFSDALNSFGVLDKKYPRSRYYSEESIHKLIELYFSKPSDIIKGILNKYKQYNTNRLSKSALKSLTLNRLSKNAVRSNLDKNSIQRLKGHIKDSQIIRKEQRNDTMNARRGLDKGGSKTRKNRK
jgi:hypothetical protein